MYRSGGCARRHDAACRLNLQTTALIGEFGLGVGLSASRLHLRALKPVLATAPRQGPAAALPMQRAPRRAAS
eukprot:6184348-Pleurochrysis_carterae.AAC.1